MFPLLTLWKKVSDVIPRNGLVAEYLFNANVFDTSGNGYNGINNGGSFVNNRHSNANSAISLNGSSNYVNIDAALSGLADNTIGSYSFWINMVDVTPSGSAEEFISFGDTNGNRFIVFDQLSSGKTRILVRNATSDDKWQILTDNIELSNNTWGHFILTQDGIEPILYIDNVKVPQQFPISDDKTWWFNDIPLLDNGRAGALSFNNSGNIFHLNGIIDDMRLYNRVLTSNERTALFEE